MTRPEVLDTNVTFPGTKMNHSSSHDGAISETLATAHLLSLGFNVAHPVVDLGVDLVVFDHGRCITVQVKSSAGRVSEINGYRYQHYAFGSKTGWPCDLNLLHAVPEDIWWVIPGTVIREHGIKRALAIYPGVKKMRNWRSGWTDPYRSAWHVVGALLERTPAQTTSWNEAQ